MLEMSKNANPDYLAKIVKLTGLRKHSNADRLQVVNIDFQQVITGMDAKEGDICVYFPLESQINGEFVSHINGYRDKTLNKDTTKAGFFELNCRVKALRLREEKSMGFIVPLHEVVTFIGNSFGYPEDIVGKTFDTINGVLLLEKYKVPARQEGSGSNKKDKQVKKLSRLIEGQVHLHEDTLNLRKNSHRIKPDDLISISYKTHGTSWWVSNVQVKRVLAWYEYILLWFGVMLDLVEYDYVYGSRKVVKNQHYTPEGQGHYFGYDLWKDVTEEVKEFIPPNYTLYGECLGYDKNGRAIQSKYDYGCKPREHKLEIYRITVTNPEGFVTELSTPEIIEFCERIPIASTTYMFYGKAKEVVENAGIEVKDDRDFSENFVRILEEKYNDIPCWMCTNKVPAEGIVVRKEGLFEFEAFKLKSFDFLEQESKQLDTGETDLESEN